jgi:hypothetical protein
MSTQQGVITTVIDIATIEKEKEVILNYLKEISKAIPVLTEEFVKMNEEIKKAGNISDLINYSKGLYEAYNKTASALKEQSKLTNDLASFYKKLEDAESDQAKQMAKVRIEIAEKNRQIKIAAEAELAAERVAKGYLDTLKQQAGSIKSLNEQNKQLRQIRDSMNTQEQVDEIQRLNTIIDANTAVIELNQDKYIQQKMNIGNYQSALDGLKEQLLAASEAMQKLASQGDTSSKEYQDLQKSVTEVTTKIDAFKKEMLNAAKDAEPLKTQLKKLKTEMQQLEFVGRSNWTKEQANRFSELQIQAAKLQDTINDVNNRIKILASDTANLDAMTDGVSAVVSGFQVWQGTLSVLGTDTEKFKEILQKLQGAQAIVNGLTTISNKLNKDSILIAKLQQLTESKGIIVRKAATIAQKALNAAQMAMPYIALAAGLVWIGKTLYDYAVSAKDAGKEQKLLNEVKEEAVEIASKEIGAMTKLFETAIVYAKGTKERAAAIKSINDQYGQYLPYLLTENSSLAELKTAYEKMIPVMAEYATIKALLNKSDEVGAKLAENAIQRNELTAALEYQKKALAGLKSESSDYYSFEKAIAYTEAEINKLDNEDIKIKTRLTDITGALNVSITKLSDARQQDYKTTEELIAIAKAETDAKRKLEDINNSLLKNDQQRTMQQLKLSTKREVENLQLQKDALSKTEAEKIKNAKIIGLIDKQIIATRQKYNRDAIKMEKKFTYDSIVSILNTRIILAEKGSQEELEARKELIREQLAYELSLLPEGHSKRNELEAKARKDIEQIDLDAFDKAMDKKLVKIKENAEKQARIMVEQQQKEERDALELYNRGELNREQYDKKISDIRHKYEIQTAKDFIAATETLLKTEALTAEQRVDIEKQLYDAKKALSDAETAHELDNIDKRNAKRKKEAELAIEYGRKAFDMAMDFLSQQSEARIAYLDAQLQEIEDKKERDLQQLDESVMSEETRAEETKRINEQAEQDRQKIEAEKRKELQKQATYEKLAALAQVGIDTGAAVMKITAQTGIFAPPFVAAAIALGAAQAAMIVSKELPAYAKGADDHPGGPAIMGDGGKKEYALLPSGKIIETVDTPAVYDIPKHTRVFPDEESMFQFFRPEVPNYITTATQTPDFSDNFDKLERGIVHAIAQNRPIQQVNLDTQGIWHIANRGNIKSRMLNDKIRK